MEASENLEKGEVPLPPATRWGALLLGQGISLLWCGTLKYAGHSLPFHLPYLPYYWLLFTLGVVLLYVTECRGSLTKALYKGVGIQVHPPPGNSRVKLFELLTATFFVLLLLIVVAEGNYLPRAYQDIFLCRDRPWHYLFLILTVIPLSALLLNTHYRFMHLLGGTLVLGASTLVFSDPPKIRGIFFLEGGLRAFCHLVVTFPFAGAAVILEQLVKEGGNMYAPKRVAVCVTLATGIVAFCYDEGPTPGVTPAFSGAKIPDFAVLYSLYLVMSIFSVWIVKWGSATVLLLSVLPTQLYTPLFFQGGPCNAYPFSVVALVGLVLFSWTPLPRKNFAVLVTTSGDVQDSGYPSGTAVTEDRKGQAV